MAVSNQAQQLCSQLSRINGRMGEIKKIAKGIKKDHVLALELWSTKDVLARLLAVLIMDKKLLTQELLDQLCDDMAVHDAQQINQISEWLMANQLMKAKPTISLLQSWQHADNAIQRRLFWYHQARLRWTGQTPPDNTAALIDSIEADLATEEASVQWTMNFCAAWIAIHQAEHRQRLITLGEKLGLYKDEKVPNNCTPSYLPEFIRIEVAKRAD